MADTKPPMFARHQAKAAALMARPLPAESERPPSLDAIRAMLRATVEIQNDATLTAEEKAERIAALKP